MLLTIILYCQVLHNLLAGKYFSVNIIMHGLNCPINLWHLDVMGMSSLTLTLIFDLGDIFSRGIFNRPVHMYSMDAKMLPWNKLFGSPVSHNYIWICGIHIAYIQFNCALRFANFRKLFLVVLSNFVKVGYIKLECTVGNWSILNP